MSFNEKMTAIADAIRDHTGLEQSLSLDDMADNIHSVQEIAYRDGHEEATDEFWDAFTNNGTRTFYEYAFRQTAFEYIRPRYKIAPSGCRSLSMFHDCSKLKKVEKAYLDLSDVTSGTAATTAGHYNTFNGCTSLEVIEDIALPKGGYYFTFAYCPNLHTIEAFRVDHDCKFNKPFVGCVDLESIVIIGNIGQSGFDVSDCAKLTHDSLMSIIGSLIETGTSLTVTLGTANLAKLTDEEKAIATEKGWSLA